MTDRQITIEEMLKDLGIWSGKTSLEPCQATTEKISKPCWKKPQGSQKKEFLFLDLRKDRSGVMPERSAVMDGLLHGECMMHSIGEFRKEESESVFLQISTGIPQQTCYLNVSEKPIQTVATKLSDILETNPDPKYQLSEKACLGILRRASARGKQLPEVLEKALNDQVTRLKSGGGREIDSLGKRAGKGPLVQTELSATLGVSTDQTLFAMQAFGQYKDGGVASALKERDWKDNTDLVCLEGNGSRPTHHGDGYTQSETMYTLNGTEHHSVAYGIDRASFNQGQNAKFDFSIEEEVQPTLTSRGPGGVGVKQ